MAELLLRKTTAKQVQQVFDKFIELFPNAVTLKNSDTRSIKHVIRSLGMEHIRAPLLKKIATMLVEKYGGRVPSSESELKALPGVGQYTANAVLNLAYGHELPLVDTNAIRVATRVFGFAPRKKRARDDKVIWLEFQKMLPKGNVREFNLGLIDFASKVCLPRKPECPSCFAFTYCNYAQKVYYKMT